ncbi:ATP-binding protein [Spirillospora sp. CA-142024]|uniref:ATP-binding protein n=1 Tax=Spirillospora sp. CA-142024 TaxID=3240036 RepID=UPI003D935491
MAREEVTKGTGEPPVQIHATREVNVTGNPVQFAGVLAGLLTYGQHRTRTNVQVSATRADDQATFCVTDDDDGIAADDKERVSTPSSACARTVATIPGGSGLGPAISRALAKGHNGTLRIEDPTPGGVLRAAAPLAQRAPD